MELARKGSSKQQQAVTEQQSGLVFAKEFNVGTLVPGQSVSIPYTIENVSSEVQFVSLELISSNRDLFGLSRRKNDELRDSVNLVLKPGCTERLYVMGQSANVTESMDVKCKARLSIGSESCGVLFWYRLIVPQVLNPKLLKSLTG